MEEKRVHRYGNILGLPELIQSISRRLERLGIDMLDMQIAVTAGSYTMQSFLPFIKVTLALLKEPIKRFKVQLWRSATMETRPFF